MLIVFASLNHFHVQYAEGFGEPPQVEAIFVKKPFATVTKLMRGFNVNFAFWLGNTHHFF